MTSVFLSYARGDDVEPFDPATSFMMRLYRDLISHGFEVWFDRVSMPSRSLSFSQEIHQAIAERDRLVLVVGPKAAASQCVRHEWQFAYFQAEQIVTPICRAGDITLVPDELKFLHCEDFRDDAQYDFHLAELVRILKDPSPPLGKLIGVPALPEHFLSRPHLLLNLREALRDDLTHPVGIGGATERVGMHGMGGIGKSMLAAMIAYDRQTRLMFPDCIVWVGLGPLPTIIDRQREVHKWLGGDGAFQTEHEGRVKLRDLLKDKGVLLILDDAWRREDVDWFDVLGPRCRAMITTRDLGLLTSLGGVHHQVELLTDHETLSMLAQAAGLEREALPPEAADLMALCGRLPLAVALCGGMIKAGTSWPDVVEALREHDLKFPSDPQHTQPQHVNLWRAMEVSVEMLAKFADREELLQNAKLRFAELAVFPPNQPIPEAAILTLWAHTAGLSARDTRKLLLLLRQRSLMQIVDRGSGAREEVERISLHAMLFSLAMRVADASIGDARTRHRLVLQAYANKCPEGWHVNPPNDGYFLTNLRQHLIATGRESELADLLNELPWLEAKNEAGLVFDLLRDFKAASDALLKTDDRRRILALLDEALRREIHFIHRHREDYPQGLFQCLWNTAWWYDAPAAAHHYIEPEGGWTAASAPWLARDGGKLCRLLETWRSAKLAVTPAFRWLRTLRPPALHLGTAQRAVLRGHEHWVQEVAFSPDGRWIVSGSYDKTVRLWDAESGAELRVLRGHKHLVQSVAFSPDSRRIVSGSYDKTVRLWDAQSGVELRVLRGHVEAVSSVAFSPDGRRIVSGSDDKTVRLWDAESGAELRVLYGHADRVSSVAFSPNGRRIVSGSDDKTVWLWDAESGVDLRVLRHEECVNVVAFSPNGRRIVSASDDKTVWLWDAENGMELRVLRGHVDWVSCVAFSPDGQRIVSCSRDETLRMWDAESGAQLRVLRGRALSVAFSPDGRRIVSGSADKTVRLWDAESGAELRVLREHEKLVIGVAFSSAGRRIVSCSDDKTVRLWDAESGLELRVLRGHKRSVSCVAFSPDGRRIVSCSMFEVWVWDAESGAELCVLREHESYVEIVAFSPDGRRIVSGSSDKTVRVWDAESGAELRILRGHKDRVHCVTFSPDGRRILSGSDDTVWLWDAESGTELRVLRGHVDGVSSVAFSPDGRRIVSGSRDKTVRLWDAETGAELRILRGHADGVGSVAFSPDGRRIVSRSWNMVRVWDAASGEPLEVIDGNGDLAAIATGPAHFPWRAIIRGLETLIQAATSGEPVAWFPGPPTLITTNPTSHSWAFDVSNHIALIKLEGGNLSM